MMQLVEGNQIGVAGSRFFEGANLTGESVRGRVGQTIQLVTERPVQSCSSPS